MATPVWSTMPLMVLPPGPMMRRIWSGLTLMVVMRGAYLRELGARRGERLEHLAEDVDAPLAGLLERLREDVAREAGDLDVHLDGGDAACSVPQTLKSMSPRWSSSPRMSLRGCAYLSLPSVMRPIAMPATGRLDRHARVHERERSRRRPRPSTTSRSTRASRRRCGSCTGTSPAPGSSAASARSARAPWPISRRPGPRIGLVSPVEKGGKL